MKVFFVGEFSFYSDIEKEELLRSWGVKYRMISYAFLRSDRCNYKEVFREIDRRNLYDEVMIDSGAYTVAIRGAKIPKSDYTRFAREFPASYYLSFDTIPYIKGVLSLPPELFDESAEETYKNFIEMRKEGVDTIPTFHKGESFYHLERLCDETDYIALSMTTSRLSALSHNMHYLDRCFEIIPDYVRVHGLGVTDTKMPILYPWHSVDSSAWVKHARCGLIKIIVPGDYHELTNEDHFTTLAVTRRSQEVKHYERVPVEYRRVVDEYLDGIGSSYEKCRDSQDERLRVNVLYYLESLGRDAVKRNFRSRRLH